METKKGKAARKVDITKYYERQNRMGNFIALKGAPKTGKTYVACWHMKKMIDRGFMVITNAKLLNLERDPISGLRVLKRNGRIIIYYITSDRDFFIAYLNTPGKHTITVFDDAQQSVMSSTDTSSAKGKDMNSLLKLWGKFQSNVYYIVHDKYCPNFLLEWECKWLYKLNYWGYYISNEKNLSFKAVRGNRKCLWVKQKSHEKPLAYNMFAVPDFDIELNLKKMYKFLADWDGDMRAGVKAFLELSDREELSEALINASWEDILREIIRRKSKRNKRWKDPHFIAKKKGYNIFPRAVLYNIQIDE